MKATFWALLLTGLGIVSMASAGGWHRANHNYDGYSNVGYYSGHHHHMGYSGGACAGGYGYGGSCSGYGYGDSCSGYGDCGGWGHHRHHHHGGDCCGYGESDFDDDCDD